MSDASKCETLGWCVVELMGHRKIVGFVREVEMFGAKLMRIDVPGSETKDETGPWQATQFYGGGSIYCITPTTAAMALQAAGINQPAPMSRWELSAAKADGLPMAGDEDDLTGDGF
jgi:hypothetical protein